MKRKTYYLHLSQSWLSQTAIGLILCLWQGVAGATIVCNGNHCQGSRAFLPAGDLTSHAANGDVNYTYEFQAWSSGDVCLKPYTSQSYLMVLTTQIGDVGGAPTWNNGTAEESFKGDRCSTHSSRACAQSKSSLSTPATYEPDEDEGVCSYNPNGSASPVYDRIAGENWGYFRNNIVAPLVTDSSKGYDANGNVIWTLDYTYPTSPQPGYFSYYEGDCGTLFCNEGGFAAGWSAYYKVVVWIKQGSPAPTLPGLPMGGISMGLCTLPPAVWITSPDSGAVFPTSSSIQIDAAAFDVDGTISSVKFYDGTTLLHTDTSAPYSYSWNTAGASSGAHTLTAKATDNCSLETTSLPVTITLQSGSPPTVSMTSPANNSIHPAGNTITLSATASDSGGSITKVAFYRGSVLIGTDYSSPYSIPWADVPPGDYSLKARAYDNSGMATYSAVVSIQVPCAPILSSETISSSTFSFSAAGQPDSTWDVYQSSDLDTWTFATTLSVNSSGAGSFSDTGVSAVTHRFYRLSQSGCCSRTVGFSRQVVPANGYALIANQFEVSDYQLDAVLPSVPPGTMIYKWQDGGSSEAFTFDDFDLVWYPVTSFSTLAPGEGGLIRNYAGSSFTVSFAGKVKEGHLVNPLPYVSSPASLIRSSLVAQPGKISEVLGYEPDGGDMVFVYRNGGYTTYYYDDFDLEWLPSEPELQVGEAVRIRPAVTKDWVRDLTLCP